jgi:sporulation protein YlmC with PRC-barrel domain
MARDYDTETLTNRDLNREESRAYRRVLSASTLAGDKVRNAAGEDLGKIEELMVDVPSGRVAYAVLSFGGFLGVGNKLFAVPWDALALDQENHEFILNVAKNTLENAPGFDKDNWPDMANASWGAKIYSFYGKTPYWETTGADTEVMGSTTRPIQREKTLGGGGGI